MMRSLKETNMGTENGTIFTVNGPIANTELGFTLPHEHIMVDFGGAATAGKHRYDANDVIEVMQPYLRNLRDQGVQTFIECTPNFLGRDVEILRILSERTGLHIISNTGLYNNQYLPDYAHAASPERLANDWIAEFEEGIGSSGIKPGFIKTAVNPQPNPIDLKLIHAAALTHKATGLTIATHTCAAAAAEKVVAVLEAHDVDLDRWIFVHAHLETDTARLLSLANAGVWIELDGLAWGGDAEHAQTLLVLLENGFEDQLLISQDAGWYNIGQEKGGEIIPYTRLKAEFLPLLRQKGVNEDIIDKITRTNPSRAFSCRD
jgi:phosphotriesterase-related protein